MIMIMIMIIINNDNNINGKVSQNVDFHLGPLGDKLVLFRYTARFSFLVCQHWECPVNI